MPLPAEQADRENQGTDLAPLTAIRTETVLSKLPIHNLAKKGRVDIRILKKDKSGTIGLKWEVSYNERHGQARQLAYKIDTLVVNRHIDELGRPLPQIMRLGSLGDIARELGLNPLDTERIKKAIKQNVGVQVDAKLTYKGRDGKQKDLEAVFHRYSVVFMGEKLPGGKRADAVYLVFDRVYGEVLNNAPDRPLNYDYLKALPPAAQRFYELISYRIFAALKYGHPEAKILYSDYCTFSAQQRYYHYQPFKKQMYKIHRAHLKSGYLAKARYESIVDGEGNPDWVLFYSPGPRAVTEFEAFHTKKTNRGEVWEEGRGEPPAQLPARAPQNDNAQKLLAYFYQMGFGITVTDPSERETELAQQLVTQYGFEEVKYTIELAWRETRDTKNPIKFFGGIQSFITRGVAEYKGHKRAKERQKKEAAAQREQQRREEDARRQDEELLAQLSPEERERLFGEARKETLQSPWTEKNPDGAIARALIKDAVIKKLKARAAE